MPNLPAPAPTPNEHLARAEALIARLDTRYDEAETSTAWPRESVMKLAELHIAAANCRAVIRSALTQQHIAGALLVDDADEDETGDLDPWEPPTQLRAVQP